ncbi:MAG: thioesterase [bacterium]|nr:thioesterase [bacterium]
MSDDPIRLGLEGTLEIVVEEQHVPPHLRGTNAEVVSTPSLVNFMEQAAFSALEEQLPSDQTSVGTVVSLKHMVGTPRGMKLRVKARLIERDRRRCLFEAEIYDEVEKVAEGQNERFIVPRERTNEKLMEKVRMVKERG